MVRKSWHIIGIERETYIRRRLDRVTWLIYNRYNRLLEGIGTRGKRPSLPLSRNRRPVIALLLRRRLPEDRADEGRGEKECL